MTGKVCKKNHRLAKQIRRERAERERQCELDAPLTRKF